MAALLLALGTVCDLASAQRTVPTDTDLKAAYCIRLLHYESGLLQSAVDGVHANIAAIGAAKSQDDAKALEELKRLARETEKQLRQRQAGLDRVMDYLTPKFPHIDPAPVVAAFNRADADISVLQSKSCPAACMEERKCFQRECAQHDIAARFEPCREIDWLPF